MMRALTGHPSLDYVDLSSHTPPDQLAAGAALGALIAANAPALKMLDVSHSALGDVGLGRLCDALPRNTHLRRLHIGVNGMSADFARHTLLPSVRANTSLRDLDVGTWWGVALGEQLPPPPEVLEAVALVVARNAPRAYYAYGC